MGNHRAVVLVGHGAPAKDCPAELVSRWKALESRRRAAGEAPTEEERRLDEQIRNWPRTPETDPYQTGMAWLAEALALLLEEDRLMVAFNEFCAPSIEEAVRNLVREGFEHVTVVPTMLTPGGVHSEEEIPEVLDNLRERFASVEIRYAWPFDRFRLAKLLAEQAGRFR